MKKSIINLDSDFDLFGKKKQVKKETEKGYPKGKTEDEIKELQRAEMDYLYHKKQMEFYKEKIKLLKGEK